jgi:hypothetical protein
MKGKNNKKERHLGSMDRSKYISILECRSINNHSSKSIAGR